VRPGQTHLNKDDFANIKRIFDNFLIFLAKLEEKWAQK